MAVKFRLALAGLISTTAALAGDAITGVSWGPQRIDVFGADSKQDVFHKYFTSFGWGPDDPNHGNLELFTKANTSSPVSVASWAQNRLDFVFVDTHGSALHKYWDGSSWGPNNMDGFDVLGRAVEGKPAITSWGENRFDVIAKSVDVKAYYHKAWTGSSYYPPAEAWENLGGNFASDPAAVSWGKNRLDIFGITNEGNISHKFWDGYQWNPVGLDWEDLGGKGFKGSPSASSMHNGRFDIWAVAEDTGELWHRFWDGYSYHNWESLGGKFNSAPQVVHWSSSRIDLLGKDSDSNYQYKYWDGHQWNGWYNKGGPFHSEPALVTISENNLNLFGVDNEGKLKLNVWDGAQWLPSYKDWYVLGDTDVGSKKDEAKKAGSKVAHKPSTNQQALTTDDSTIKIELKFRA